LDHEEIEFGSSGQRVVLSTARAYAFKADSADLACEGGVCKSTIRLEWLRKDRGSVSLALSNISSVSGGGDFGLYASSDLQTSRVDMLFTGRAWSFSLRRGTIVEITLWWLAGAKFRMSGFSWTGAWEDAAEGGTLDAQNADLVESIVSLHMELFALL
jgi:hypothetical protein